MQFIHSTGMKIRNIRTLYDFTHVLTADKDVYAEAYDLYTLEFKLTEGSYASASVDKKKVTELYHRDR